jgi:hypothetical protein
MPLPLLALLGIGAGMGVAQGITNNIGARKNQQQADRNNIKFWQMQNQYNDPVEQMTRLKKAGLNPNLVYGQSVGGATGQAGQVSPSKAAPFGIDAASGAMSALQAYQADAQVNNTNVDTLEKLQKVSVDKKFLEPMAREELNKMSLSNLQQHLQNKQLAPFVQTSVERAAEQLQTIKAGTGTAQAKQKVSEFQARLSQLNINPTGTLGMTLLRMVMASIPELQEYLNPPFKQ